MAEAALPQTCPPTNVLWVWPAAAAYLGTALDLAPHSTSVHCLVVGVDDPVTVRIDGQNDLIARSVLIAPRVVHQVVIAPGARILFCYTDVNRARAVDLFARMRRRVGDFGVGHDGEASLIQLCNNDVPDGAAIMTAALGEQRYPVDPRIARATERILGDPATAPAASETARLEGLSPSYFQRLFGAQTGTSLRRYRRWARMLRAARAVAAGADLTRASADAGFASPSHFSDSFSAMFGLSASALASSGVHLVIADEERVRREG